MCLYRYAIFVFNLVALVVHGGLFSLYPALSCDLLDNMQEADIVVRHARYLYGMLQGILSNGSEVPGHYDYLAVNVHIISVIGYACLLYTSPSPRDGLLSRMPSSA